MNGLEAVAACDRLIESVRRSKRVGQRFPIGFEKELLAVRAYVASVSAGVQQELFSLQAASDA